MSLFSESSTGPVSSSKRNAGPDCSEVGFERLSTFDVRFSINLKISLWSLLSFLFWTFRALFKKNGWSKWSNLITFLSG